MKARLLSKFLCATMVISCTAIPSLAQQQRDKWPTGQIPNDRPKLAPRQQAMDLSQLRDVHWRPDVHDFLLIGEDVVCHAGMTYWEKENGGIHGSGGQDAILRARFPNIKPGIKEGVWLEPKVEMIASIKLGYFAQLENVGKTLLIHSSKTGKINPKVRKYQAEFVCENKIDSSGLFLWDDVNGLRKVKNVKRRSYSFRTQTGEVLLVQGLENQNPVFKVMELDLDAGKITNSSTVRVDARSLSLKGTGRTPRTPVFANRKKVVFAGQNQLITVDPAGNVVASVEALLGDTLDSGGPDIHCVVEIGRAFGRTKNGYIEYDLNNNKILREFGLKDNRGQDFKGWNIHYSENHLLLENWDGVLKVSWPDLKPAGFFTYLKTAKTDPIPPDSKPGRLDAISNGPRWGALFSRYGQKHFYQAGDEWILRMSHAKD